MTGSPASRGFGAVLRWLSLVLAVGALGYVAAAAGQNWRMGQVRAEFAVTGLSSAFVVILVSLFLLAWTWHWVVARMGIRVGRRQALYAWFASNLYKYLPGQIWAPVGRIAIGSRFGIPARAALVTTAAEQMFSLLSAAVVCAAALGLITPVILLGLLSAACIHPYVANAALAAVSRILRRPMVLVPLRARHLLILYMVSYCSLCLSVVALGCVLGSVGSFRVSEVRTYVMALTASSMAGQLFFGAPAGLGIREAAMAVALTRAGLTRPEGSAVALLLRLLAVLAEASGFLIALAAAGRGRREQDSAP